VLHPNGASLGYLGRVAGRGRSDFCPFVHHISRDGDPQLHVHAAIANMVQRADGADMKWRALDGRQAYRMRLWIAAHVDRRWNRG
jgi:hypothetical protein